jgi:hypothetical protein
MTKLYNFSKYFMRRSVFAVSCAKKSPDSTGKCNTAAFGAFIILTSGNTYRPDGVFASIGDGQHMV